VRIAWVLYGDLSLRTGGTIYDAEVVEGLRRAGHTVLVVSLPHANLTQALRSSAVDAVVGDELCFRELAIAFHRLGRGRPKRILLVHHLSAWETEHSRLRRWVLRVMESFALGGADHVLATSQTTRKRLQSEGVRVPITVALPGADRLPASEAARTSQPATEFLFLGSIVPRKRVLELVEGFAQGAHQHAKLVLLGSPLRDARYAKLVAARVRELGLEDCIAFRGEVSEPQVANALARADALVMPSSLEGYGIAATEAIHAGLPVIAARAAGLTEALAPCAAACLWADEDAPLATVLLRFALDESLRTVMQAEARAAAPHMPTWNSCVEAFQAVLEAIA
jgi:glycosyltransferase involved in cell wall biosynthesis